MSYLLRALIPLLGSFVLAGCSDSDEPPPASSRGNLLKSEQVAELAVDEASTYLEGFDLDVSKVQSGVDGYRLVYRTIDANGKPATASALLALPRRDDASPVAVWMHGTTLFRGEAASVNDQSDDRAAAFYLAAAGYTTVAPDYLGLGESPGTHPYDDADTEVSASVDALLAAKRFLQQRQIGFGPQVFVTGHSQGARASLELGNTLEGGALPGLELAGLAPISGPYDMSYTLSLAVSEGIAFTTGYVSYLVVAWNRLHHLYDSPRDAFLPPYDATIEGLFDNTHPPEQVLGALPETLEELFTPAFLAELRHPTGALKAALRRADRACSYGSSVPVTLFAASGDEDVPIANAEHCLTELEQHDTNVTLVDVGAVDHSTSATLSLPLVVDDFAAR
jgi:pimeloyl-ACP methyl ester carboxylesterase